MGHKKDKQGDKAKNPEDFVWKSWETEVKEVKDYGRIKEYVLLN
jgi:hypothetical protein